MRKSYLLSKAGLAVLFCSIFTTLVHAQLPTPTDFDLVEIQKVNPTILIDLKYATPDNFTKETVYTFNKCYLKSIVALKLSAVQKELNHQNLGLKVWDGYRPMAAQKRFWELVPDPRYVSPPGKGGRHTRGTAIDLTLVDLKGNELPMPTPYDDFSLRAHRNYMKLPQHIIRNRSILQNTMAKHGFTGLRTEWWHFDYKYWRQFPPIPLTMEQLKEKQTHNK